MSSLTLMLAAVSSVNWALKLNPNFLKKSIDFLRSLTGRLMKIFLAMCSPFKKHPFPAVRRTGKRQIDRDGEILPIHLKRKYGPLY